MKKQILITVIAGAMLLAVTACSTTTSSSSSDSSSISSTTTTTENSSSSEGTSSSMSDSSSMQMPMTVSAKFADALMKSLPAEDLKHMPVFSLDYVKASDMLKAIADGTYTGTDSKALMDLSMMLDMFTKSSYFDATGEADFDKTMMMNKENVMKLKAHIDMLAKGEKPTVDDAMKKMLMAGAETFMNAKTSDGMAILGTLQYDKDKALMMSDLEGLAMSATMMNTKAHNVIIAKPMAGKEDMVMKALENKLAMVKQAFANYLPDQKVIADAGMVEKLSDGTVVLVITENSANVMKSIKSALGM